MAEEAKRMYQYEQEGCSLYWGEVRGGIGLESRPTMRDSLGYVGMILDKEGKILRTVTAIVDDATMQALDTAIVRGGVNLPEKGRVLDAADLIVASVAAAPVAQGVAYR